MARGGEVVVIGPSQSAEVLSLQQFLSRNGMPHQILYVDHEKQTRSLVKYLAVDATQLSVAICPDHAVLHSLSVTSLADALGLSPESNPAQIYDVAVIGAGPAGRATAVHRLSTRGRVILDSKWGALHPLFRASDDQISAVKFN